MIANANVSLWSLPSSIMKEKNFLLHLTLPSVTGTAHQTTSEEKMPFPTEPPITSSGDYSLLFLYIFQFIHLISFSIYIFYQSKNETILRQTT